MVDYPRDPKLTTEKSEPLELTLIKEKIAILTDKEKLEFISIIKPQAVPYLIRGVTLLDMFKDSEYMEAVEPLQGVYTKVLELSISTDGIGRKDIINAFNSLNMSNNNQNESPLYNLFKGSM